MLHLRTHLISPRFPRSFSTMSPVPLSSIPTLTTLYSQSHLSSPDVALKPPNPTHNAKISLIRTDLTTLGVSAIVNAANTSLLGGGGVDGAIHRAAGPDLLQECHTLNGCDTGSAKITGAFRLPCDKVIHAVGPVYSGARAERSAELLRGCYRTALDLAVEHGCASVAFAALSTGVYGYPSMEAAKVAVGAVRAWLDEDEVRAGELERVVFCSFLEKDERAYEVVVPKYFPPASDDAGDEGVEITDGDGDFEKGDGMEGGEEKLPSLPDVPTKEPTEPGEPEHKRARLDSDA